jgi:hypothetical protein
MRAIAAFVLVAGCAAGQSAAPAPVTASSEPAGAWEPVEPWRPFALPAAEPPTPLLAITAPPAQARTVVLLEPKQGPRSLPLPNGLFNPMPGGTLGGYEADTGLDIAGFHQPVFAIAAATLVYSEEGHTRWTSDDRAVLVHLDEPIPWGDRQITHVWYAHLHELVYEQARGAHERYHVDGGAQLGISGVANKSPHLHLGLLLDGVTNQRWGSYLLADEVRAVLGNWRPRQRLPKH